MRNHRTGQASGQGKSIRQIYLIISVIVIGLGSVLLLDWVMQTPTVQAQTDPNAPAATHALYLPVIAGNTDTNRIKSKSGIHLGNRDASDWRSDLFTLITGTVTGTWPAAVVVQSDQLYTLHRYESGMCRIEYTEVKRTGEGEPYNLFLYLTEAISHGVKVIIRITPSPGNFTDYANPGDNHILLPTTVPAGGNYCGSPDIQKKKVRQYRDILDIAQEMKAIYQVNTEYGWYTDSFYFEPANEPNYEWYEEFRKQGKNVDPHVENKQAWLDMDAYFAALYDEAKTVERHLQILTPPISQDLFGHHFTLGTCEARTVGEGGQHAGLDFMKKTYGYDYAVTDQSPAKADGFSWHNYWQAGQETWETNGVVSLDFFCNYEEGGYKDLKVRSDHIAQYFPDKMAYTIRESGKPIFITEADLLSPCQKASSHYSKENIPGDATDFVGATRQSLLNFVEQEFAAHYVVIWLLTNQHEGDNNCANSNTEINWHEAYREDGPARAWFRDWWTDAK